MARNNGGSFWKTIGLISGTAVVSVVATRMFDRFVAPKLGLGEGGGQKALPPAEEEESVRPAPPAPGSPQYNPYAMLTPLPPPTLVPMPIPMAMPQWTPPWMQQSQMPNPKMSRFSDLDDDDDEDEVDDDGFEDNVEEFIKESTN